MSKGKRFRKPLTDREKVNFAVVGGMFRCLDEMSDARGISRSELMRRLVAKAIVTDSPVVLAKIAKADRDAIEQLADLI